MDNTVAKAVQSTKQPNVCVWLKPDGQVDRQVDRSLEEHIACIQSASVAWIDYTINDMDKDLEKVAAMAGFTQLPIQKLLSGFLSSYEDADTELGIMMPAIIVTGFEIKVRPVIILIKNNFLMTIHEGDVNRIMKFARYAPTFLKKAKADNRADRLTLILERILDENNDRNFEYLREIEKHGDDISKRLIDEDLDKKIVAREIYEMKHVLIIYLNALWASKDVIDSLRYGDADLITDDEKLLGRIGILSDNIDRHIELSEQMSNVLASGLEVMQSIYNNRLQTMNNRFAIVTAYLTVFGTAFLWPNTIATVVSSVPWDMSEAWWYIPFLIISTIIATGISFLWVWRMWYYTQDDTLKKKR
ncbi:MAG: CorA-like Mg2+ transporter protein [Methanocella sp. PtaU1.Bin125]|nr:MAG: CorA-like Mg2+ transporter protein [Methanocella sp. PtaU1.Bin125]